MAHACRLVSTSPLKLTVRPCFASLSARCCQQDCRRDRSLYCCTTRAVRTMGAGDAFVVSAALGLSAGEAIAKRSTTRSHTRAAANEARAREEEEAPPAAKRARCGSNCMSPPPFNALPGVRLEVLVGAERLLTRATVLQNFADGRSALLLEPQGVDREGSPAGSETAEGEGQLVAHDLRRCPARPLLGDDASLRPLPRKMLARLVEGHAARLAALAGHATLFGGAVAVPHAPVRPVDARCLDDENESGKEVGADCSQQWARATNAAHLRRGARVRCFWCAEPSRRRAWCEGVVGAVDLPQSRAEVRFEAGSKATVGWVSPLLEWVEVHKADKVSEAEAVAASQPEDPLQLLLSGPKQTPPPARAAAPPAASGLQQLARSLSGASPQTPSLIAGAVSAGAGRETPTLMVGGGGAEASPGVGDNLGAGETPLATLNPVAAQVEELRAAVERATAEAAAARMHGEALATRVVELELEASAASEAALVKMGARVVELEVARAASEAVLKVARAESELTRAESAKLFQRVEQLETEEARAASETVLKVARAENEFTRAESTKLSERVEQLETARAGDAKLALTLAELEAAAADSAALEARVATLEATGGKSGEKLMARIEAIEAERKEPGGRGQAKLMARIEAIEAERKEPGGRGQAKLMARIEAIEAERKEPGRRGQAKLLARIEALESESLVGRVLSLERVHAEGASSRAKLASRVAELEAAPQAAPLEGRLSGLEAAREAATARVASLEAASKRPSLEAAALSGRVSVLEALAARVAALEQRQGGGQQLAPPSSPIGAPLQYRSDDSDEAISEAPLELEEPSASTPDARWADGSGGKSGSTPLSAAAVPPLPASPLQLWGTASPTAMEIDGANGTGGDDANAALRSPPYAARGGEQGKALAANTDACVEARALERDFDLVASKGGGSGSGSADERPVVQPSTNRTALSPQSQLQLQRAAAAASAELAAADTSIKPDARLDVRPDAETPQGGAASAAQLMGAPGGASGGATYSGGRRRGAKLLSAARRVRFTRPSPAASTADATATVTVAAAATPEASGAPVPAFIPGPSPALTASARRAESPPSAPQAQAQAQVQGSSPPAPSASRRPLKSCLKGSGADVVEMAAQLSAYRELCESLLQSSADGIGSDTAAAARIRERLQAAQRAAVGGAVAELRGYAPTPPPAGAAAAARSDKRKERKAVRFADEVAGGTAPLARFQ